jgi:hypothetical protein
MIRGSDPGRGKLFSPARPSNQLWDPPVLLFNGQWDYFFAVKAAGVWGWLLLSNAGLKMNGDLHSFSLICLHGEWRENFTFTLHLNCKKSLYQLVTVKVQLSLSTPWIFIWQQKIVYLFLSLTPYDYVKVKNVITKTIIFVILTTIILQERLGNA